MAAVAGELLLVLEHVSFGAVEFEAILPDGSTRFVHVCVGSGSSFRQAVRFPNMDNEAGRSLGNDLLDEQVKRRAAEELLRLEASVREVRRAR